MLPRAAKALPCSTKHTQPRSWGQSSNGPGRMGKPTSNRSSNPSHVHAWPPPAPHARHARATKSASPAHKPGLAFPASLPSGPPAQLRTLPLAAPRTAPPASACGCMCVGCQDPGLPTGGGMPIAAKSGGAPLGGPFFV